MSRTECQEFPPEWCAVRWVDNVRVIEKNLELLPHVKTFVSIFTSKTAPDTISFVKVKAACSDKLYEAKLKFFLSVANQLKPFLTCFQTDKPMMPFMAGELFNIIRGLAQCFVKRSVLEGAKSLTKLLTVDFTKEENCLSCLDVDIGFGAKAPLKNVQVSELLRLNFQRNCIKFLTATTAKIFENSLVRYQMICRLSCLDPDIMAEQPNGASKMFGNMLSTLQEAKWLDDESCNLARQQYENFCVSEKKALG